MASQKREDDADERASGPEVSSSCRRKKNFGSGSFVSDLRDHFHEFLSASAAEHRTCFKDTIHKMFKTSNVVKENSGGRIEGEVSLPLQTTMAD
ncbi:dipeptide transport ATP-binding protein [Parasponia andersonii]|uniref:Dipeptide transport ATP-binding protein n=1 Tax=Parasponia andersonii TaxID=3476 RepID=A0A2P5D304_PARAD|nr:dipeptide transport ATP-binding protein [Parasponia andersonii]